MHSCNALAAKHHEPGMSSEGDRKLWRIWTFGVSFRDMEKDDSVVRVATGSKKL
jgi:hypothetical protein